MDIFTYTLKIEEANKATTKKHKMELFNNAVDAMPYWGYRSTPLTQDHILNFKLATYMLHLDRVTVAKVKRIQQLNVTAGKIAQTYANKEMTLEEYTSIFEFLPKANYKQFGTLFSTLADDIIPMEIKFQLGLLGADINESV